MKEILEEYGLTIVYVILFGVFIAAGIAALQYVSI